MLILDKKKKDQNKRLMVHNLEMLEKEQNRSKEFRRKKIIKIGEIFVIVNKNLVETVNKANMGSLKRLKK